MKNTIAIIGATGLMGSALAGNLTKAGYPLLLMGRDHDRLNALAEEIKAFGGSHVEAIGCAREAAWEADIILPAVPYAAQAEVADHIKAVAIGKIVISIINPFNQSFDGLMTAPGSSAAEELQHQLPNSKVVKAFNTNFAADLGRIAGAPFDCFVAGEDYAAGAISQLVKDAGFNPVIAGKLEASRTLESMMLMLYGLSQRCGQNSNVSWKVLANSTEP